MSLVRDSGLRVAASLMLAATAACSFTVGFDGFVAPGGGDGGGAREDDVSANPDASDGGGLDAKSSSETDGNADEDGADPNVPPVFVDAGTFCTTTDAPSTFCEDFDTAPLSGRWLREGVYGKLTSYAPKSAPNVFLVDVPPSTAGGTFVSKISRLFDTSSTSVVLGFDIKPERVNLGSSVFILGALEWARADSKYSLRLVYSNGSVRLEESNLVPPPDNRDAYHPFFQIPEGRWSRITLDIVASGPSPGAQLMIDGIAVGTRETLAPTAGIDPRPTLILGAVYAANPHTGWTLRYDDVMLSFR